MRKMIEFELKKIAMKKSVFAVIGIVFILSVFAIVANNLIYFCSFQKDAETFYHQLSGRYTKELEREIEDYSQSKKLPRDLSEQLNVIKARKSNEELMKNKADQIRTYGKVKKESTYEKRADIIKEKYKSSHPYVLNQLEWKRTFQLTDLFYFLFLIVIVVAASAFSIEKDSKMSVIVHATLYGRFQMRLSKILAMYLFLLGINITYFIWIFIVLKICGFDFLHAGELLYNITEFQLACSDVSIVKLLVFTLICCFLLSCVVATFTMLLSKMVKNSRITVVIGSFFTGLLNVFELQYYLRFWNNCGKKVSDFSPEIQRFMKYEKAFNPFALTNPCYYFEKIRYGEWLGHYVPIYVFPIVSSILVILVLSFFILMGKESYRSVFEKVRRKQK